MSANGPHSLGGFKGKGKAHKGDHRPAKKSSGGGTTGAMFWVPVLALGGMAAAIVSAVGYVAFGHLAG